MRMAKPVDDADQMIADAVDLTVQALGQAVETKTDAEARECYVKGALKKLKIAVAAFRSAALEAAKPKNATLTEAIDPDGAKDAFTGDDDADPKPEDDDPRIGEIGGCDEEDDLGGPDDQGAGDGDE